MAMALPSSDDYEALKEGVPLSILEADCVGNIVVRADGGEDHGTQSNLDGASTNATNTVAPITVFEIECHGTLPTVVTSNHDLSLKHIIF